MSGVMHPARVAVVTGGAGGLGRAVAARLAADGCTVVMADRDLQAAGAAAASIGANARPAAVDVADPAAVTRLMEETARTHGRIDVLVNSAGIGRLYDFLEHPFDSWRHTLSVNLDGVFLCGQAAARVMCRNGGGSILNLASVAGFRAGSGRIAYGTSKAAVIHLTRQMAVDLAPHGITANAIAPGPVETDMTRNVYTEATRRYYRDAIPLGRFGTPEDVADAAAFLTGPQARYVTGQTLCIDGGFTAAGVVARDIAAGQGTA